MATDAELLHDYAIVHDEDAFGALVQRHVDLVYSVALRQVGGDAHLAQDVAQRVFADLAIKAKALSGRATLGGWLYRATQFAASDLVRAERARRAREQEAQVMQELSRDSGSAADWEKLRPLLDNAISELNEADRDAVVLRFFEARPFAHIGAILRVSEDAARMRVDRSLDKLHRALARRGVTSTGAALSAALASQVSGAAPTAVSASITTAALTSVPAGGAAAVFLMGMTKVQIGIAAALMAGFATAYLVQANSNAAMQREITSVAPPAHAAAALRAENQRLADTAAEVNRLRQDDAVLQQLGQRVADMKKATEERTRAVQLRTQELRQRFYDAIRADEARSQEEVDRMNREGNALVNEYKRLVAMSNDTTQSPEVRADASADAKAKLDAIKLKRQEIQAFTRNFQAALAQRIDAFRRTYGDDPSLPPPKLPVSVGRMELRPVPREAADGGGNASRGQN